MSEIYYQYFTETEVVYFRPNLKHDFLKIPVYYYSLETDDCGDGSLTTEDGSDYVLANGTAVLRSNFVHNKT